MPKSEDYLVYGDDDRVEQENLKDLSALADALLTVDQKKNEKPVDGLEDIEDDLLEEPVKQEEDEEGDESPSQTPQKPNLKPTKLFWVLAGCVAVFLLGIILVISNASRKNDGTSEATSTTTSEPTEAADAGAQETIAPTTTPEPSSSANADTSEAVNKEGYLKAIDKNHAYTLSESLAFAKTVNDTTKDYLTYAVNVVSSYQSDQTVDIKEQISVKKEMLGYDVETIKTYETMFDTYGGGDYIRVAEERLSNVKEMYDAITQDYATVNDLVVKTNEYISKENENADKAKTNLIAYLNTNSVTYHVDDSQISYDELQFAQGDE